RRDAGTAKSAEDEYPPEAEYDARYRSEQLDERGDHRARPARRELAQVEADRNRNRGRDRKRDERGDRGAPDEVERRELVPAYIPALIREEAETELRDCRICDIEDLPGDRNQQRPCSRGCCSGEPVEKEVPEAVAK